MSKVFYILPGVKTKLITYAFDFDGTLTPHPGSDKQSLWYMKSNYWVLLSDEMKHLTKMLFMRLPSQIIIISRNYSTNVYNFLNSINPNVIPRVNNSLSAFLDSELTSTRRGKSTAWKLLMGTTKPILYSDDSMDEISEFNHGFVSQNHGQVDGYHAVPWLGQTDSWNRLVKTANQLFLTQIPTPLALLFGIQLIENNQIYPARLLTGKPSITWITEPKVYYTLMLYNSSWPNHQIHYLSINIPGTQLSQGIDVIPYEPINKSNTENTTMVMAIYTQQKQITPFKLQRRVKFPLFDIVAQFKLTLTHSLSFVVQYL